MNLTTLIEKLCKLNKSQYDPFSGTKQYNPEIKFLFKQGADLNNDISCEIDDISIGTDGTVENDNYAICLTLFEGVNRNGKKIQ